MSASDISRNDKEMKAEITAALGKKHQRDTGCNVGKTWKAQK
jgi:hypothetical protein